MFGLPGVLAFIGDFWGDFGGLQLPVEVLRLWPLPYGGVLCRPSSASSSNAWLPTLPLRTRAPMVAMASPFQFPLPALDLGSGASRSAIEAGTGIPLVLGRGMRDVLGLTV